MSLRSFPPFLRIVGNDKDLPLWPSRNQAKGTGDIYMPISVSISTFMYFFFPCFHIQEWSLWTKKRIMSMEFITKRNKKPPATPFVLEHHIYFL